MLSAELSKAVLENQELAASATAAAAAFDATAAAAISSAATAMADAAAAASIGAVGNFANDNSYSNDENEAALEEAKARYQHLLATQGERHEAKLLAQRSAHDSASRAMQDQV
jgi:hypothetical protein